MRYLKLYEAFKGITFKKWLKSVNIRSNNNFTNCEHFTDEGFTDLKGIEIFTNLRNLDCRNNKLKSLEGIENLKNLTKLTCSNNQIENLEAVKNLTNIEYIDCRNNQIENLEDLKNLKKLKYLHCKTNLLENLHGIENLKMVWLCCADNKLKNLDELENQDKNFPNNLYSYENDFDYPYRFAKWFGMANIYFESDILKLKSYEVQKKIFTDHKDRIDDLKEQIGFNDKIKKEFPAIAIGYEWGFFDLERVSK